MGKVAPFVRILLDSARSAYKALSRDVARYAKPVSRTRLMRLIADGHDDLNGQVFKN